MEGKFFNKIPANNNIEDSIIKEGLIENINEKDDIDEIMHLFEEGKTQEMENEKQNMSEIKQFFDDLAEEIKPEIYKRIDAFKLEESFADEIERDIKESYSLFYKDLISLSGKKFGTK